MNQIILGVKRDIINYITHLSAYDYIAYAWVFLLFILVLTLSIIISNKRPIFSIFLIFLNFVFLIFSPLFVDIFMQKSVKKSKVIIEKQEFLHYGNSLIIEGKVKNLGKIDFKECKVKVRVYKFSKNFLKRYFYLLKPLRKKTIWIKDLIPKKGQKGFRVVIDKIKFKKDLNISVKAECY